MSTTTLPGGDPAGSAASADVVVTGHAVTTVFGRGADRLSAGLAGGVARFSAIERFDVQRRRVGVAAVLPEAQDLHTELAWVAGEALQEAGLRDRAADLPFLLARHADPAVARMPVDRQPEAAAAHTAAALREAVGLGPDLLTYTNACVAASSAVADAASRIRRGLVDRVLVLAGYLVDEDNHALFDAGRALSPEGAVRPFSAGRAGLLLGDGVAAVVLESAAAARDRGAPALARLTGWGRAGDGYHVCQPDPTGRGMARAIERALERAGRTAADVGYVNAHGTGTRYNDAGEASALLAVGAGELATVPVSSTKALTGHTLEASGLVELCILIGVLAGGDLPVNAAWTGPDPACAVDVVRRRGVRPQAPCLVSLNAAFGGANTALVLEAA